MTDDSQSCDTTPLHTAASRGNLDEVREMLKTKQYEVDVRNSHNQTSLHLACANGHLDMVWTLANDFGADIGAIDNDRNTPLLFAAKNKHVQIIIMLILLSMLGRQVVNGIRQSCSFSHTELDSHHIQIFEDVLFEYYNNSEAVEKTMQMISNFFLDQCINYNDEGFFVLLVAASFGLKDLINQLVTEKKADINVIGFHGLSVLHCACFGGQMLLVESLISEYGIDALVKDENGQSILHYAAIGGAPYACGYGYTEMMDKLVMEYDLDPAESDGDGNTPLHVAAAKGQTEILRHLILKYKLKVDSTNHYNITPLMRAVLNGCVNVSEVLVKEFNSSCHLRGNNGHTLLHYACHGGHIELIDKLVMEYGFESTVSDGDGNTPLHIAAGAGHVETVRHLISKHSADIDCTNNQNSTPLMVAVGNCHEIVIHALIEFNCSPHVRGYNGQTLLHYACQNGHIKLLNKLVTEHKVDPSIRDNDGNTPLHLLCRTLYAEEEKLRIILCEHRYWTVFQVNNNGNTPLHTATRYGQADCAYLLLQEYNAPLFVQNKDGRTALDLAKALGNRHIASIFLSNDFEIQSTYEQLDKLAKKEFAGEKNLTRIFVVGHPGAGKSTLVETIKKEGFFSYFSTSTVTPHTPGIIPSIYDSNTYGRMILYDFAGDSEYYSSHAAIMESINTSKGSNIYLIVCDLSEGEEAVVTKYSYWLSFLSYNIKQFSNTIILPVGSHADDFMNKASVQQVLRVLNDVSQKFCNSSNIDNLHIEQSVALDCRNRGAAVDSIKKLATKFFDLVSPIRLSPETSTLLGLLRKDFEHIPACKVNLLISHIEDTGIPLPLNSLLLYSLIRELHDLGLLMVIEREGDSIENHIIILKISAFTSDVHNKMFSTSAKANLTKHIDQLKLSVGIIPESLLEKVLPEYITKESLLKLQYCHEIENLHVEEDHTLSQIAVPTECATKEKYHLFFPALCDLKLEEIQWPKFEGDKITWGWYAKCDGDRFDFFPTRFLHVLIVHLSHNFALKQSLPTRHRLSTTASDSLIAEVYAANPRCRVWSTGLHWLMKNGVEVFVDMPKDADSKELIVLVRSDSKNRVECLNTLQLVIQKVVETKVEFCAGIVPTVYLLDPSNLKDEPFTNARNAPKYALSDIEEALAEGTERVMDKEGQCFSTPIKDWISPTSWAITYWNWLFPMDTVLVHSLLQEVNGAQWKLLGMSLAIPWNKLGAIENEAFFPGDIAKKQEVIRLWMSQEPTWIMLVDALSQSAYGWSQNSSQISQEHNVTLQEKILCESNSSLRPDEDFLQYFAAIIGSRWQSLAFPLSLTSEDIVSIKRETKGVKPTRQALVMLQKWAARETATYGQLRERLRTLSVFHI